jgi:aminoglycoside phosphotransferase (APT) family kinase protein
MSPRPSQDACWASVRQTLRDVILPQLSDAHARQTAIHLIGLADYQLHRSPTHEVIADASLDLDAQLVESAVLGEAFRGRLPEATNKPSLTLHQPTLASYLSEQVGHPVEVQRARRLSVGHSRAMYRVATSSTPDLVVRMEQGGVFGTTGETEFHVMAALARVGAPVAPMRWLEPTGSVLGRPFFVMDYVDGDVTDDERLVGDIVAADFVRTLAALHNLDPSAVGLPAINDAEATHIQLERWADVARWAVGGYIGDLLEDARVWLHTHAPSPQQVTLVHGDAGPGNLIHRGGQVVAITDWEFAHLGDPMEDWSFCLSMRGSRTMPRERWLQLFQDIAGVTRPRAEWDYWEAFNLFKGACANLSCIEVFESGANRAPNMAIIGTHLHQHFLRRLTDLIAGLSGGNQ